jgi:hypothetical protein
MKLKINLSYFGIFCLSQYHTNIIPIKIVQKAKVLLSRFLYFKTKTAAMTVSRGLSISIKSHPILLLAVPGIKFKVLSSLLRAAGRP